MSSMESHCGNPCSMRVPLRCQVSMERQFRSFSSRGLSCNAYLCLHLTPGLQIVTNLGLKAAVSMLCLPFVPEIVFLNSGYSIFVAFLNLLSKDHWLVSTESIARRCSESTCQLWLRRFWFPSSSGSRRLHHTFSNRTCIKLRIPLSHATDAILPSAAFFKPYWALMRAMSIHWEHSSPCCSWSQTVQTTASRLIHSRSPRAWQSIDTSQTVRGSCSTADFEQAAGQKRMRKNREFGTCVRTYDPALLPKALQCRYLPGKKMQANYFFLYAFWRILRRGRIFLVLLNAMTTTMITMITATKTLTPATSPISLEPIEGAL